MQCKPLLLGALLVPAALLFNAGSAAAQDKSFTARLGVARLMDGESRDAFDDNTGKIGLSYGFDIAKYPKLKPRVDLDYARFSDGGNRLVNIGVSGNVAIPFGKNPDSGPYALVGLGIYRVSVDTGGAVTGGTGGGGTGGGGSGGSGGQVLTLTQSLIAANADESKTKLGVNLGVGYKFTDRFSGELTYTILGKVAGAKADNLALSLGVSF